MPSPVITLTAVQCPVVQVGPLYPAGTIAAAYASPNGTAPASANFSAGMTSLAVNGLNADSMRLDLASLDGGGLIRAIAPGSFVLAASGLTLSTGGGRAQINGTVELTAGTSATATLANNAQNYIWVTQQTYTSCILEVVQTASPPASAAVYIGRMTTVSGAVTQYDVSGVMQAGGGPRYRLTADAGPPTDTPPEGCPPFRTLTLANGIWDWNPFSGEFEQFTAPVDLPVSYLQLASDNVTPVGSVVTAQRLAGQMVPSVITVGGVTYLVLTMPGIVDPTT